jgi:DNA-binding HxlR family transcriptional regulator
LDHLGDKWSLLFLRDLIFFNKHSYSELQHSEEKMATNILSSRLEKLESVGLISKQTAQNDKRKKLYTLTQAGKDTLTILLKMIVWSSKYGKGLNLPAQVLERMKNDREGLINDLLTNIKSAS